MKLTALIPARSGSKRIPNKNTKLLAGRPLIEYTIAAAQESGVFSQIAVSSDSEDTLKLVEQLDGRVTTILCPLSIAHKDNDPDILWIQHALGIVAECEEFAILRPTSPFRTAETIKRATDQWCRSAEPRDSLRAIEPVIQHPGKMWTRPSDSLLITPLLLQPVGQPWHSSPTQTLPQVYVQNACIEIAWTDTVRRTGTIAGERVLGFKTHENEGVDLNTLKDWFWAEYLIATG